MLVAPFKPPSINNKKIRVVAHSMMASVEKTSFSAMRTSFYEIMRKRKIRPVGFWAWATFGCSIATCSGLLCMEIELSILLSQSLQLLQ